MPLIGSLLFFFYRCLCSQGSHLFFHQQYIFKKSLLPLHLHLHPNVIGSSLVHSASNQSNSAQWILSKNRQMSSHTPVKTACSSVSILFWYTTAGRPPPSHKTPKTKQTRKRVRWMQRTSGIILVLEMVLQTNNASFLLAWHQPPSCHSAGWKTVEPFIKAALFLSFILMSATHFISGELRRSHIHHSAAMWSTFLSTTLSQISVDDH